MSDAPVPFLNVLSEPRLIGLTADLVAGTRAGNTLLEEYLHLRRKLFDVSAVIKEHGSTELQLLVSNILVGREAS